MSADRPESSDEKIWKIQRRYDERSNRALNRFIHSALLCGALTLGGIVYNVRTSINPLKDSPIVREYGELVTLRDLMQRCDDTIDKLVIDSDPTISEGQYQPIDLGPQIKTLDERLEVIRRDETYVAYEAREEECNSSLRDIRGIIPSAFGIVSISILLSLLFSRREDFEKERDLEICATKGSYNRP